MKYEVYRNRNSCDDDFEFIDALYKRVMSEDKVLCANAQKNLNTGVFVNGEMHPKMEKGPLFFQKTVRDLLQAHHEREIDEGQEIWPACQSLPSKASGSQNDISFCLAVNRGRSMGLDSRATIDV